MSFSIDQRLVALERVITEAANTSHAAEVSSYLCRFGSVLVCGHLERCLELILCEKFEGTMPSQMSAFLRRYFGAGTNYDCDRIVALLNRFDTTWGVALETFIASNQRVKESVSSCYAVRNSVSHGGGQSLGARVLKQYFDDVVTLIAEVEFIVRST
ncbi:HEPN domain-containing protein [Methylobacterium komagatae]|uniref:HEPN domain-containing protein n=1 Tax=Methylobacterium komagatae TaxID=374425 RepID=A0ABW2BNY2_9HYPH